jgi:hypothetical protein
VKLAEQDWAHAGRALFLCSGLACLTLALIAQVSDGPGSLMLRLWVGGFGLMISLSALKRGK